MKNTYLTSYFPLIAIVLFSMAFAIFGEVWIIEQLKHVGVYNGMLEFFSESGIKLAIFFVLSLFFFMLFSALKLLADTITGLSILFFAQNPEENFHYQLRFGSTIFVVGGLISFVFTSYLVGILAVFLLSTLVYFVYFAYRVGEHLSVGRLIGLTLFNVLIWALFFTLVIYICVRLYNSFLASLPI